MADDPNSTVQSGTGDAQAGQNAADQPQNSITGEFSDFGQKDCKEFVEAIYVDYERYIKFFLQGAESAAVEATKLTKDARTWRLRLIWLSGAVALLNTAAAFSLFNNWGIMEFDSAETNGKYSVTVAVILTIISAMVAVFATIVGNIENFWAYGEKSARKRELREMYYGAYLKYLTRWKTQVAPHGAKPSACVVAAQMLENMVEDLSAIRKQAGEIEAGKQNGAGATSAGQG